MKLDDDMKIELVRRIRIGYGDALNFLISIVINKPNKNINRARIEVHKANTHMKSSNSL